MALQTPNYFDENKRIRTPSKPFEQEKDYSEIVRQLRETCREYKYLGISPQNLVAPAELLSVILVRKIFPEGRLYVMLDPRIIAVSGSRKQYDACGNVFLSREGKKVTPVVVVVRPTQVVLSYKTLQGEGKIETFKDLKHANNRDQCPTGMLVHEMEHLRGRLIVDHARERLCNAQVVLRETVSEMPELELDARAYANAIMPHVLVREGDQYILRHGSEFDEGSVPIANEDAMFVDSFWKEPQQIEKTYVPRGGELLPIKLSEFSEKRLTAR